MKIRNYGLSMVLCALVVGPWAMAGCNQVEIQCQVGHAETAAYATLFKLKSQTGTMCPAPKVYDEVGFDDFHPTTIANENSPTPGPPDRDVAITSVYVQTPELFDIQQGEACYTDADPTSGYKGNSALTDSKDPIWGIGKFRALLPDAADLCYIDTMSTAKQVIPTIPVTKPAPSCGPAAACSNGDGTFNDSCACSKSVTADCCDVVGKSGPDLSTCHSSPQPAVDVEYTWSNIKMLTTAAAPGTQMSGSLTYKNDTCTQEYDVVGIWPEVDCTLTDAGTLPEEMGTPVPIGKDGKPLPPGATPLPNPLACCPNPDPTHNFPLGSGIDPDFQVKCDPVLLKCVLDIDKPIPQLDVGGNPLGCPAIQPIADSE